MLFLAPAYAATPLQFMTQEDFEKFQDIQLYDATNYTSAPGFTLFGNTTATVVNDNGEQVIYFSSPVAGDAFNLIWDSNVPNNYSFFFITYREEKGAISMRTTNASGTFFDRGYLPAQETYVTRLFYLDKYASGGVIKLYLNTGNNGIYIKNFGLMNAKPRKIPGFSLGGVYRFEGYDANYNWISEAFTPAISDNEADDVTGESSLGYGGSSYFILQKTTREPVDLRFYTVDRRIKSGASSQLLEITRNNQVAVIYMDDQAGAVVKLNGKEIAPVTDSRVPQGKRLYILTNLEKGDTIDVTADSFGYLVLTPDPLSYESYTENFYRMIGVLVFVGAVGALLEAIRRMKA